MSRGTKAAPQAPAHPEEPQEELRAESQRTAVMRTSRAEGAVGRKSPRPRARPFTKRPRPRLRLTHLGERRRTEILNNRDFHRHA